MKITYIFLMLSMSITFFSCNEDEQRTCITCNSDLTTPFELCREGDGNASVNGENTGVSYDAHLAGLEETGVICN